MVHTLGNSSCEIEIKELVLKARQWMIDHGRQINLDFDGEKLHAEKILDNITAHKQVGLELTIGKIFVSIGFGVIEDEIFKWLVLYRLMYPKSKLKTTEYLQRYHGIVYDENQILKQKKTRLTPPTKVIEIAANLFEIELTLPDSKESIKKKLILTEEHREIANLSNF